jgi:mannose-6-phosphate isomerase-like protein (cupin superfamily)
VRAGRVLRARFRPWRAALATFTEGGRTQVAHNQLCEDGVTWQPTMQCTQSSESSLRYQSESLVLPPARRHGTKGWTEMEQNATDERTSTRDYLVIERDELRDAELQGREYGAVNVSLIFVDAGPGEGPRLHRHAYEEVFIVLEGQSRFTVGAQTVDARAGQIIIVRPGVAHKFVNSGEGRLRQIDIHPSGTFVTEWLEE